MNHLREMIVAVVMLLPLVAVGEPPTLSTVVVNAPDQLVPVQGAVSVTEGPRDAVADRLDQSIHCIGTGASFYCDAVWEGSIIIEGVTAHCTPNLGGTVYAVSLITNQKQGMPGGVPAEKVFIYPGNNVTVANAMEGAKRTLPARPLTLVVGISAYVAPTTVNALVPADRFLRVLFEGDMASANCWLDLNGRWLR